MTRARILAAARICFARTGYAATTNKDIAERAGVTPAAIYLYFDAKSALYLAAVQDANEQLLLHYRRAVAETHTLPDGFRALCSTSQRVHEHDPSLAAFLSALPVEMQRDEELARAVTARPNQVVALVVELVDAGVRRGEIARAAAPHVGATFIACLMGFSLYFASVDGSHGSEIVAVFEAMLDGTLFHEPAAPARARKPRKPT